MLGWLLLALVVSPAPPQPVAAALEECTNGCNYEGDHWVCYFYLEQHCTRWRPKCLQTELIECRSGNVLISPWNPDVDGMRKPVEQNTFSYPERTPRSDPSPPPPAPASFGFAL